MKFAFIAAEKATFPVRVLCRTLEVSRAGFYAWHTRPPAARTLADQRLGVEIQAIHAKGAGAGPVNKKTVLTAELQKGLPYGDAVGKLLTVDWDTINANRTAWNNRWTREIER